MKTIDFLWNFINADAKVTLAKQNGDIIYEGIVLEMNFSIVDYTEVVGVELGACRDLIITIKEESK